MEGKKYWYNEETDEKVVINGCLRSDEEVAGAAPFSNYMLYQPNQLPPAIDLRPYMTPVENQGSTASCVANALAGAYEYLLKRHQLKDVDVSRLFIYYNARLRSYPPGQMGDNGCHIPRAIQSLQVEGTCLENQWPFVQQMVNRQPYQQLYDVAKPNTVAEPIQLGVDLNQMKSCLAQGYPFIFSLRLYRSFALTRYNGGIVSTPQPGEPTLGVHNLHAMLCVGYIDQNRMFIVRNSWGPQWGDEGYIYIPYDYLGNPQLCSDAFTIRKLNNMDLGQEHWISDISQIHIAEPTFFGAAAEEKISKWVVKDADENEKAGAEAPEEDEYQRRRSESDEGGSEDEFN